MPNEPGLVDGGGGSGGDQLRGVLSDWSGTLCVTRAVNFHSELTMSEGGGSGRSLTMEVKGLLALTLVVLQEAQAADRRARRVQTKSGFRSRSKIARELANKKGHRVTYADNTVTKNCTRLNALFEEAWEKAGQKGSPPAWIEVRQGFGRRLSFPLTVTDDVEGDD
jgi:hypothetical protein